MKRKSWKDSLAENSGRIEALITIIHSHWCELTPDCVNWCFVIVCTLFNWVTRATNKLDWSLLLSFESSQLLSCPAASHSLPCCRAQNAHLASFSKRWNKDKVAAGGWLCTIQQSTMCPCEYWRREGRCPSFPNEDFGFCAAAAASCVLQQAN